MAKLLKLKNIKSQINSQVSKTSHQTIFLEAIQNYFDRMEIYYYDEDNNIYIGSNIYKIIKYAFKQHNIINYWMPRFTQIEFDIKKKIYYGKW